ncbi:centrosomal protein of 164 kDa-like [Pollicipes pollicipes]|uniref:centrosomal protein of 164 kDa-like n=1 Tax=Pollicipes pollicipes TaxID=41117 RepID=UPI0018859965|nr:centrosomal protein of 164 kDa-like [Pollicipes pollicipes]
MNRRPVAGAKAAQVVCEEIFDEDSVATHDEVLEFAKRIGIDPESEPHLLHIADEGVNQTLPAGWKPCFEEQQGLLYYFNFRSGETRWEHPLDAIYRDKVVLARKQLSSTAGGSTVPEFGRSRRLCAEEEREKKNVSFAPSVHQIEFDLDEEEEDYQDDQEDADIINEKQSASWLREKLDEPGRHGGDRLTLLRTAPDRDDSLEMAQDLTEDSQMSLHASEGSESPRRELERRKEAEVRAALLERRREEERDIPYQNNRDAARPLSFTEKLLARKASAPPPQNAPPLITTPTTPSSRAKQELARGAPSEVKIAHDQREKGRPEAIPFIDEPSEASLRKAGKLRRSASGEDGSGDAQEDGSEESCEESDEDESVSSERPELADENEVRVNETGEVSVSRGGSFLRSDSEAAVPTAAR